MLQECACRDLEGRRATGGRISECGSPIADLGFDLAQDRIKKIRREKEELIFPNV